MQNTRTYQFNFKVTFKGKVIWSKESNFYTAGQLKTRLGKQS